MASMKSQHPIFELTEAETLLVSMAARLLTALRYKEATPGGDFSHFAAKIEEEMNLFIDICTTYDPTPPMPFYRFHPIISLTLREWNLSEKEQRPPSFDKITGKEVDEFCASLASN
ncbi:hypothetical protein V8E53_004781, partial [Lactarius tabidus]